MNSVARTLELSIASHSPVTPEHRREERRRDLKATPNPVKRAIGISLDTLARDHPTAASKLLDGIVRTQGMQYLGHGADSSVYRRGSQVLKVFRATAIMTPGDRAAFEREASDRVKTAKTFLGEICLEQTYGIEKHPLGGYMVALAKQPYVGGQPLDMFDMGSSELRIDGLAQLLEAREDAAQEVIKFLDGAADLHDNHGLMPDLNGSDNFRIHGKHQQIALIDPAPIAYADHPPHL